MINLVAWAGSLVHSSPNDLLINDFSLLVLLNSYIFSVLVPFFFFCGFIVMSSR